MSKQTNITKFTKTYESVMRLDQYVTPEGEVIPLSLTLKVLWQYMYGKYQYYASLGSHLYENMGDIAKNSGVALRSVHRGITTLEKIGAVRVTKKKLNGFIFSNCYEVLDPVALLLDKQKPKFTQRKVPAEDTF